MSKDYLIAGTNFQEKCFDDLHYWANAIPDRNELCNCGAYAYQLDGYGKLVDATKEEIR